MDIENDSMNIEEEESIVNREDYTTEDDEPKIIKKRTHSNHSNEREITLVLQQLVPEYQNYGFKNFKFESAKYIPYYFMIPLSKWCPVAKRNHSATQTFLHVTPYGIKIGIR